MKESNVVMFRYLNTHDTHNEKYKWCSRAYEYPTVLDFLEYAECRTVHNTACGHMEIHKLFQHDLDLKFECQHTDIESFNIVSSKSDKKYDADL